MNRVADIVRFYTLLDRLKRSLGGSRMLANIGSYRDWPQRGIYFFFEPSEMRSDRGKEPRVVRIGTHALTAGSRSTLRQRLAQHRGRTSGGGNHRGSIFRLLIGQALLARGGFAHCPSWGVKGAAKQASIAVGMTREALASAEAPVEQAVTLYLSTMPFLHVDIADEPGPDSLRGVIERNSIALLSNYERIPLDPPSPDWLGHASDRPLVRGSGLWNQRHTEETYDSGFLDLLEMLIARMEMGQ